MEFACSICQYTSYAKIDVIRHINRKRSCGPGIKEIIEIPIEIKCEFCNKNFSTKPNLKDHIKNRCKEKDKAKDEEIKQLKETIKELKSKPTTINNYGTINILINNYENTSLEKITDKIYNKLIKGADEPYQIIPRFIKEIHFNPNIPENHNVYLSNRTKNNKHLQVYKDGHWEIKNKDVELDNLINDRETNLSDWMAEKGEKYPDAFEKFNEYLDQKYDEDVAKLIKEEVEQVLYNNKHMIRTQ
jgi:uncharacterized protein YjgD (DUF1641 family)